MGGGRVAAITAKYSETDSATEGDRERERQTDRQRQAAAGTADSEAAKGICLCGKRAGAWQQGGCVCDMARGGRDGGGGEAGLRKVRRGTGS